jgi:nitrogen fixation/metabolism regulation signal transduction histidine kinase
VDRDGSGGWALPGAIAGAPAWQVASGLVLLALLVRVGAERLGHELEGFVVTFDDISALVVAQRTAAWADVARRIAHEIKNPLTPIQLSAERLRRKYLKQLGPEDGEVLDRATNTIVQQVDAMKQMVNAFSEYARAPDMDIASMDLDKLAHEVVDLYRGQKSNIRIELMTDKQLPLIEADLGRIGQILHNLLRNAIEALESSDDGLIEVTIENAQFNGVDVVELTVVDNGPGFQSGSVSQIFDPYVTTKPKGTGLGLAVVKKLVEEHAGIIDADNREEGGAVMRIRLPIDEAAREAMIAMSPGRAEIHREKRA